MNARELRNRLIRLLEGQDELVLQTLVADEHHQHPAVAITVENTAFLLVVLKP